MPLFPLKRLIMIKHFGSPKYTYKSCKCSGIMMDRFVNKLRMANILEHVFTEYTLKLQLLRNVCIFMTHMFINTPSDYNLKCETPPGHDLIYEFKSALFI